MYGRQAAPQSATRPTVVAFQDLIGISIYNILFPLHRQPSMSTFQFNILQLSILLYIAVLTSRTQNRYSASTPDCVTTNAIHTCKKPPETSVNMRVPNNIHAVTALVMTVWSLVGCSNTSEEHAASNWEIKALRFVLAA
jgi:hypothetical protein